MKATTMHPQGTPQTGAAPGPAVPPAAATLRPVGPHLVIAPPGAEDDSLWAALGGLPAVPDALILLVATANAAPVLRQQLPELARTARARGRAPSCSPPPAWPPPLGAGGARPSRWPGWSG